MKYLYKYIDWQLFKDINLVLLSLLFLFSAFFVEGLVSIAYLLCALAFLYYIRGKK